MPPLIALHVRSGGFYFPRATLFFKPVRNILSALPVWRYARRSTVGVFSCQMPVLYD